MKARLHPSDPITDSLLRSSDHSGPLRHKGNAAIALYVQCMYTGVVAGSAGKDVRWNVRVASDDDDLVRQAASVSDRNLSDFILQAAIVEAERVLADRTRFVLDEERWAEFVNLLDRPAEANPRLARLFTSPTVFE